MLLTLYGEEIRLYGEALALYPVANENAAPFRGAWGVQDTRAADRRQKNDDTARRRDADERRRAVERAFKALSPDVATETVPEAVTVKVARIAAPDLGLPVADLAGVADAIARLEATIAAVWADMRAEAIRLEREQEDEAAILLLLMA